MQALREAPGRDKKKGNRAAFAQGVLFFQIAMKIRPRGGIERRIKNEAEAGPCRKVILQAPLLERAGVMIVSSQAESCQEDAR